MRESEEGFKLLTVQEKNWDTTRRGLDPKPADRNRIERELTMDYWPDRVKEKCKENKSYAIAHGLDD